MTARDHPPGSPQYDGVAEQYDRLIRPRYDAIAALVADRVRELLDPATAEVVELSAGTGALTHQLAPSTRSYLATDLSPAMLEVGRGRDAVGCEHVEWRVADVTDLPFPDGSANLVVCSLGPFQDSETGLAESRRILRDGGLLVASAWGDDYLELELLAEARRRLDLPPRATTSAAEISRRLDGAGYVDVEVRAVRLPVVHASIEAYLDYRAAFGPVPDLTVDDSRELNRTIADCAAAYTDAGGRVVLDWQLLVMSGRA